MNNDDLNTLIFRITSKCCAGKPGIAESESMLERTGLPFRMVTKKYSRSEIEADPRLLAEVKSCFGKIPGAVEVSTVFGRAQDKQTFYDLLNELLRKQKAELNRKTDGKRK